MYIKVITMKKIAIFTVGFNRGGTERALISLLNGLSKQDVKVTVYCLKREGDLLKEVPNNCNIKNIEFKNDFYQFWCLDEKIQHITPKLVVYKILRDRLKKKYSKCRYDNHFYNEIIKNVIINEEYDLAIDFWGYGNITTAIVAKVVNAKSKATWLHDEEVEYLEWVEEYLPDYNHVVGVSQANKIAFEKKYPQYIAKSKVIYNLTDTDIICQKSKLQIDDKRYQGDFKILTIGRLEEQKGFDYAIDAARIMKERNLDFKWFIIGDGTLRDTLNDSIINNDLEKQFILLGQKANPFPYLLNCELYVQPSRHEGYSTTIVEARTLNRLIIASDIPSNREQIKDGENGYIVALDSEAIANKIEKIINQECDVDKIMSNIKADKLEFKSEINKVLEL